MSHLNVIRKHGLIFSFRIALHRLPTIHGLSIRPQNLGPPDFFRDTFVFANQSNVDLAPLFRLVSMNATLSHHTRKSSVSLYAIHEYCRTKSRVDLPFDYSDQRPLEMSIFSRDWATGFDCSHGFM